MVGPGKKEKVKEIKEKLTQAKTVILTDYRGLNVRDLADLRRLLKEQGAEYKIFKNTLIKIAAQEAELEGLAPYLEGPTALAFGQTDETSAARVLADFAKDHEVLKIKAGVLEQEVIDEARVKMLASLPTKEELIAILIRLLRAPASNLINALTSPARSVVFALKNIAAQKS